ncbi:MAG TPA: ATPase, T2SS/T4P/T4SS family [bacterium]|nr:ATPase, T2SS/T4P/T4SS family [bacterium]
MINSDQVQKKLNDLLNGQDDGIEEEVFLAEDLQASKTIIPQPRKDEPVVQPAKREEEDKPLYERMLGAESVEPVEGVSAIDEEEKADEPVTLPEEEKEESGDKPRDLSEDKRDKEKDDEESKAREFMNGSFNFLHKSEEELNDKIKAMELARKEDGIKMRAMNLGLGYIDLKGLPIMPEVLKFIDEKEALELKVICFLYKRQEEIRLATVELTDEVRKIAQRLQQENPGVSVLIYLTSQESMDAALKLYSSLPRRVERINDIEVLEREIAQFGLRIGGLDEIQEKINSASTTEILGVVVMAATRIEASDIHIEAEESSIKLRFRVDGVLHDVAFLPKETWNNLVARIKLNAGLKINVQDRPQDGNFTLRVQDKPVDFRVSILPTNYGESVVMRILFHDKIRKLGLDNLGIDEYNRMLLEKEINKPNGLLVITGPTGSGKTTTLYSILNKLNSSDNKIITVEDPIEYKLEGINQSEVREDKGYTFAKALRSIVRQDPDILLVGEIRDQETVEIVLNAALTGHLALSTIHANSAAGVIPRFMALGAKPYLLSPALNVSISQRLVRRVCGSCKQQMNLTEGERERVRAAMNSLSEARKRILKPNELAEPIFYTGKGCQACSGLGYRGQVGLFEILQVTDEIKQMILAGDIAEQKLKETAIRNGMVTLEQDGIIKAINGITSLEEVFRVA